MQLERVILFLAILYFRKNIIGSCDRSHIVLWNIYSEAIGCPTAAPRRIKILVVIVVVVEACKACVYRKLNSGPGADTGRKISAHAQCYILRRVLTIQTRKA